MARETEPSTAATRRSYDRIAARYMERFEHELDGKPFDREFLDNVAAANRPNGWLVDLGGVRARSVRISPSKACAS